MSYQNGTPFLNLPQTVGTDKRDWFDTNEAFLDLDGKVKSAYEGSIDTASALAALTEVVSGISSDVSDLQTTVGNHTTSIGTINEALLLINSALTTLNGTVTGKFDSAGIADPYDAEHGTYDVGDVVTYNGQRYECHTAVTAAEPFDADKWTAVDVQTKLDQINNALALNNVSVTADGVKTYSQLLDELFALVDTSKINANSVLEMGATGTTSLYRPISIRSSLVSYTQPSVDSSNGARNGQIIMKASSSTYFSAAGSTVTDLSAQVPDDGIIIKVTFG